MSEQIYILGGARRKEGQGGQYLYRYDSVTGGLELLSINYPDVMIGQQCYDSDRDISYVVEEIDNQKGEIGGGGYVWAFCLNKDEKKLELLNYKPSMAPNPAYICIDKSKHYAVVAHHVLKHHVTRVVKTEEGKFKTEVIFEDGVIAVFRLEEDGGFGEVTDVISIAGENKPGMRTFCHPHWVGTDPTGELYVVTDCGSDRIFTYHLDREKGKLIPLTTTEAGYGYWPRYAVFHPDLPVFYDSNEMKTVVQAYRYDVDSGVLEKICEEEMLLDIFKNGRELHSEPTDIVMHPNKRHIYAATRAYDCIAVFDIEADGMLTLKQNISCGGENPRGIFITPNGKHLYSLNRDTPNVAGFAVAEDGTLSSIGVVNEHCISTMAAFVLEE